MHHPARAWRKDAAITAEDEIREENLRKLSLLTLACALYAASAASAADQQVERGKYLVTLGGCNDCHTPGYFLGKPACHAFTAARMWASRFRVRCLCGPNHHTRQKDRHR